MSKFYKIELLNTGAEYTFGAVTEKIEINVLRESIDNADVSSSIPYNDGDDYLECFNIDLMYQVYGPEVSGANVTVTEYSNEDYSDEVNVLVDGEDIYEMDEITTFSSSNPYASPEYKEKYSDDTLLWGTQKIEKRIHFPAVIELEDDEVFEISNIFVGSLNTDETISCSEIVDGIYYIRPEAQVKLVQEYLDDDYTKEDTLQDFIHEVVSENKNGVEVLKDYAMENLDIEGKGEYENDYSIIKTLDDEIIYEDSEY